MRTQGLALVVVDGESAGRRIAVGERPVVVGRGFGVDFRIKDPTVSRHHCVFWLADGRCWVRDLGSTNRTRVNDHDVQTAEVSEGDVLVIGETTLAISTVENRNASTPVIRKAASGA